MAHGMIGFDPLAAPEHGYRTIWSLDSGWGTFAMTPGRLVLTVLAGTLTLASMRVPAARAHAVTSAALHRIAPSPAGGEPAAATTTVVAIGNSSGRALTFAAPVTIGAGQELILGYR